MAKFATKGLTSFIALSMIMRIRRPFSSFTPMRYQEGVPVPPFWMGQKNSVFVPLILFIGPLHAILIYFFTHNSSVLIYSREKDEENTH